MALDWAGPELKIDDYAPIVGDAQLALLRRLADRLRGKRVLHINSTRSGGGVAEILRRMVPLMNDLGLQADWAVIRGNDEFYAITKSFHNALQGEDVDFTREKFDHLYECNRDNMKLIDTDAYDFVVVHDPQPAAMVEKKKGRARWIWRCHIDVSHPHRGVWNYLYQYVCRYDAAIFSMSEFAQELPIREVLIHPSIDPLSEKNHELDQAEIDAVYSHYDIARDKPVLLQVSRFDRFKDPLGVVKSYKMVKKHHDCTLILAGGTASDDPEGEAVLAEVREQAAGDPDIHVLLLPHDDRLINALQRGADIIYQKSLKEGFGLTVSEALWKGKPVIGGSAGGIALQVHDGHTGYLVESSEGASYWTRFMLEHPETRRHLGQVGREHVRRNFLTTRNLLDYLGLFLIVQDDARGLHYIH